MQGVPQLGQHRGGHGAAERPDEPAGHQRPQPSRAPFGHPSVDGRRWAGIRDDGRRGSSVRAWRSSSSRPPDRRRRLARPVCPLVVALLGGYWYERPLLLTGTGYAAHNACRCSSSPGVPMRRPTCRPTRWCPTCAAAPTRAPTRPGRRCSEPWRTRPPGTPPGYGCTLAAAAPCLRCRHPGARHRNPFAAVAAPAPDPAVTAALAKAFGDDLPAPARQALGTRAVSRCRVAVWSPSATPRPSPRPPRSSAGRWPRA